MQILVFDLGELISGWLHLYAGVQRRVFHRPVDFYLKRAVRGGLSCRETESDGQVNTCFICGYAIACIQLPSGWKVETCSASGLKALKGGGFAQWQEHLPSSQNLLNSVESQPGT